MAAVFPQLKAKTLKDGSVFPGIDGETFPEYNRRLQEANEQIPDTEPPVENKPGEPAKVAPEPVQPLPHKLSTAYKPIDSKFRVLQDTTFIPNGSNAKTANGESSSKVENSGGTFQKVQGVVASNALFSKYQVFAYKTNTDPENFRETSNNSIGKDATKIEPTFDNLVENWSLTPTKQLYSWSDFLYCKYYDMIPNNYLITLRRYPMPIVDNPSNIKIENNTDSVFPAIAQAVTWMGEETGNSLSDIMNMNASLAWRVIESKINTVEGNEKGGQGSMMQFLTGGKNANQNKQQEQWQEAAKQNADKAEPFSNTLFGKLNVTKDVQVRDRGLLFAQEFEIKFHYALKLHDHINPKIAMIDCIANILSLCYNNGSFWGGTNRYFPNVNRTQFFGDQNALYSGQYSKYFDSTKEQFSKISSGAGNFFKDLMSNPLDALKKLGGEAANFALGNVLADSRPKLVGFPALMTGAPTGDWHLVVGNPFNPILTIGNLICKNVSFKFSDQLSHDDFPDMMTVTIKLEHARSRDKGDIESMFNTGKGRVYYSIDNEPEKVDKNAPPNTTSNNYFNSRGDIPNAMQNISNTFYKALTSI